MSAGEFVSVSSPANSEGADLHREHTELTQDPQGERNELAGIYMTRGLDRGLAIRVAEKLMAPDALGDELDEALFD